MVISSPIQVNNQACDTKSQKMKTSALPTNKLIATNEPIDSYSVLTCYIWMRCSMEISLLFVLKESLACLQGGVQAKSNALH
jgi:hypothetical protein